MTEKAKSQTASEVAWLLRGQIKTIDYEDALAAAKAVLRLLARRARSEKKRTTK